jgi:hypothetical protein
MAINVRKDPFAPKEDSPIITKDRYEVSESDIGYSIPVSDKSGAILFYRKCSPEEYVNWYDLMRSVNE